MHTEFRLSSRFLMGTCSGRLVVDVVVIREVTRRYLAMQVSMSPGVAVV